MNLPKAIELSKDAVSSLKKGKFQDHAAAVSLGVEAIKRIEDWRKGTVLNPDLLLPGETD